MTAVSKVVSCLISCDTTTFIYYSQLTYMLYECDMTRFVDMLRFRHSLSTSLEFDLLLYTSQVLLGEVNAGLSTTQVVVKELKASASVQDQMQFLEEVQPYRSVHKDTGDHTAQLCSPSYSINQRK